MGIFELAKVITLAFAFGALGVLITAVIVVRVIAKRRPELFEDEDEDEEDDEPTRRIDFNNLKFGKDYEI